MKVEIWSDVVCPWCYIGKRRFETALARFEHASDVEVEWRSFQLNPDQPRGTREPLDESLARKMGSSVDQVREMNARVTDLAAAEGLEYHFETYRVVNTFDAHRVMHLAKAQGLGTEAHERLLRAQLVEGEILEDHPTLVRLAAEVGVPAEDTTRALATDAFAADVEADIALARTFGVSGVPFFVIDRRYGVSGAQPAQLFLEALQTAHREAAAGGA
ncbi:MAG TPA: DsbA family oxidoreductase [Candidatus Limnocylindrales bacterium]|nr:DsbA family oxidoreductase [Candidatus Limnocylindrales bacterium]